jgi:CBS domain-containing protein
MHVSAILKHKGNSVVTVVPSAGVDHVARLLMKHRIGAVVVVDSHKRPVGIVSERDITTGIARIGRDVFQHRVERLMTPDVITCQSTDTHAQVMERMSERHIRHMPVIDDEGRLTGIISIGDAVKARLDESELEVDTMRSYAAGIR